MTTKYTPQSLCRFGIARCDITPPVGMYHRMWGAAKHDQSTGVHRPLVATAFVIADVDETELQVVVVLDHVLLWSNEMERLLTGVRNGTNLSDDQLLVTFSHTHAAGLVDLDRASLPGGDLIEPYLAELIEKSAAIIREARESMQSACIAYAVGRCNMAAHRDSWDETSRQFVCGFNPTGDADDTLLVARVTNDADEMIAVLVDYACHPTTLAWDNTLISPDFPGAMRDVVESTTDSTCVFLQGASGDLGPREGFVGDVEVAEKNGRQLGYAVLSALESLPPPRTKYEYIGPVVSGATIGVWEHRPLSTSELTQAAAWGTKRWCVDLPYRANLPTADQMQSDMAEWQEKERQAMSNGDSQSARDCRAMVERKQRQLTRLQSLPVGDHFPFPVSLWRIGAAIWVWVEGELYQWFQQTLRQAFPGRPIVVVTLTNGSRISYLPVQETYGTGIYQETIAYLAAGSLETLKGAISKQISDWLT